jgi:hypothetical protein
MHGFLIIGHVSHMQQQRILCRPCQRPRKRVGQSTSSSSRGRCDFKLEFNMSGIANTKLERDSFPCKICYPWMEGRQDGPYFAIPRWHGQYTPGLNVVMHASQSGNQRRVCCAMVPKLIKLLSHTRDGPE